MHSNSKSHLHHYTFLVMKRWILSCPSLLLTSLWSLKCLSYLSSTNRTFFICINLFYHSQESGQPFIVIAGNRCWMFILEGTLKWYSAWYFPLSKTLTCRLEGWLWTVSSASSHSVEEWLHSAILQVHYTVLQWWQAFAVEKKIRNVSTLPAQYLLVSFCLSVVLLPF